MLDLRNFDVKWVHLLVDFPQLCRLLLLVLLVHHGALPLLAILLWAGQTRLVEGCLQLRQLRAFRHLDAGAKDGCTSAQSRSRACWDGRSGEDRRAENEACITCSDCSNRYLRSSGLSPI